MIILGLENFKSFTNLIFFYILKFKGFTNPIESFNGFLKTKKINISKIFVFKLIFLNFLRFLSYLSVKIL